MGLDFVLYTPGNKHREGACPAPLLVGSSTITNVHSTTPGSVSNGHSQYACQVWRFFCIVTIMTWHIRRPVQLKVDGTHNMNSRVTPARPDIDKTLMLHDMLPGLHASDMPMVGYAGDMQ